MEPSTSSTKRPRLDSEEGEIPVYLKLTKTVSSNVKPTETIKNLKELLFEKGIVSEDNLFYAGKLLEDGERLVDYGIQRNSTLHLVLRDSDGVKLLIKIPSQKRTVVMEARAHDTVRSIKSLIEVTEGIKSDQFSLNNEGKLLEEDRTLISLHVKNGSTIRLVFCQKDVLPIYVKALTGEVAKLEVKVTFSVADVKAIAESILGVSRGSLFYSGQQLEDSKIIACYDIEEGSMLEMLQLLRQVFVKTWIGRTLTLDVKWSTTIQDVKDKIKERLEIPVHLQSIIYDGKRLEEERDLASYGIQNHCTLSMVLAPKSTVVHMKVSEISSSISHLTTIHALKEAIRCKDGSAVKEVLFREKPLVDSFCLKDYGINKNTTLAVVF